MSITELELKRLKLVKIAKYNLMLRIIFWIIANLCFYNIYSIICI
jgi:hypothetical protein